MEYSGSNPFHTTELSSGRADSSLPLMPTQAHTRTSIATGLVYTLTASNSSICVFSSNTTGDPIVNLLVIIITIVCLFVYLGLLGGVYKHWPLNLLEYVFFLNLAFLSSGTLYTIAVEKSIHPVTQLSIGITLVIITVIILYHSIQSFVKRCRVKDKLSTVKCKISQKRKNDKDNNIIVDEEQTECHVVEHPTMTYFVVGMEDTLLYQ